MITIENIEYKQANSKVQFSNGANLKIHFDILVKFKLEEGKQLAKQDYQHILQENEKLLATNLAVRYVQTALKTKKQVADYLHKKGFSKECLTEVINKLIEYKFINDEEYAKIYVRTYKNKFGKYKLANNLFQKGISKELIEEGLLEIDNVQDTLYNIASKYLSKKEKNLQNFNKLYRFLLGRGYEHEEVSRVVARIKNECENN